MKFVNFVHLHILLRVAWIAQSVTAGLCEKRSISMCENFLGRWRPIACAFALAFAIQPTLPTPVRVAFPVTYWAFSFLVLRAKCTTVAHILHFIHELVPFFFDNPKSLDRSFSSSRPLSFLPDKPQATRRSFSEVVTNLGRPFAQER